MAERGWKDGGYSKQHVQKCAHCAAANTNAIKHSINESRRLGREGKQEWELERRTRFVAAALATPRGGVS